MSLGISTARAIDVLYDPVSTCARTKTIFYSSIDYCDPVKTFQNKYY